MRALKRTGAAGAVLGLALSAMGVLAPPASADHGNNGTIKVDEQALDGGPGENGPGAHNSNDPHIDCAGRIEWYGFDEGAQTADVLFEVWNPTLPTGDADAQPSKSYDDFTGIDGDGPGGTELDGHLNFDLSDLLDDYQPHPQQGYHVKVTVHTTASQGADVKHKVFWVAPCESDQDAFGGLRIDKELAGNDSGSHSATEFEFTVACSLGGSAIDLTPEETTSTAAVVVLTGDDDADELTGFAHLPAGAVCTITETDDGDADSTTWFVDGEETTPSVHGGGHEYVTVTIAGDDEIVVRATNRFDTAGSTLGNLSVNKDVAGNDVPAAGTLFTFRVDCSNGGQVLDLDTSTAATFVTFTLTAAQAAHAISGLPTGAVCSVTESNAQGADSTSWTVGGVDRGTGSSVTNVVIGNATTVAVVATNHFNRNIVVVPTTGSLSIDKVLDGNDPPAPGTQFTFRVVCEEGGVPVDLNGADAGTTLSFTLTAAQAARVLSGIPTGTVCSVEELDDGGARSTSWTVGGVPAGDDDSVEDLIVGNGTTIAVVATNLFQTEVGGVVTPRPPVVTPPVVTPPLPGPSVSPVPQQRPGASVLGAVQTRSLPRTGGDALPLAEAGFGLVLLGFGLTLSTRRHTAA